MAKLFVQGAKGVYLCNVVSDERLAISDGHTILLDYLTTNYLTTNLNFNYYDRRKEEGHLGIGAEDYHCGGIGHCGCVGGNGVPNVVVAVFADAARYVPTILLDYLTTNYLTTN